MRLVIVRHATAVDRIAGNDDEADAARALTDRGRKRFRKVVRGLHRLGLRVDLLLTSPWTRAVETGALLAPIVAGNGERVRVTPHLAAPPRGALLSELAGPARVGIVGHEPWLGELVALLTFGDVRHGEAVPFRKGGVAILEGEPAPGQMRLTSVLPPRVLRKIG